MRILLGITAAALALPLAVNAQPPDQSSMPPVQQDFPANVPQTRPDDTTTRSPEANMPSGPDSQAATPAPGDSSATTPSDTSKASKHKRDKESRTR